MYKVYLLADPNTLKIRYIGYTNQDIKIRYKQHISFAKRCIKGKGRRKYIVNWLSSIEFKPIMKILKIFNTQEEARELEVILINKYKDRLVNLQDRGLCKDTIWKQETALAISATLKAKYISGELEKQGNRTIFVYNREGKLIGEYDSCQSAASNLSIPKRKPSAVANDTCRYYTNYTFSFQNSIPLHKYFILIDIFKKQKFFFLTKEDIRDFLGLDYSTFDRNINCRVFKDKYIILFEQQADSIIYIKNMPIIVENIESKEIRYYKDMNDLVTTLRLFSHYTFINANIDKGLITNGEYKIRRLNTARIKLGELLESLEVGNQQPSISLNV